MQDDADRQTETRALLAELGTAMIATGQPVQEIEEELTEVSVRLGYPDVQTAVGPTGLMVGLTPGGPTTFRSAPPGLRLHQSASVRLIRHQLVHGELTPAAARDELAATAKRPVQQPAWLVALAWPVLAVGIALILQPGWANIAAAAVGALIVLALVHLAERYEVVKALLPTLAAVTVSLVVFGAANAGLLEGPLRTVLPPLAVLLPGALVVNGMSELASGHMQAGSARLTYGLAQLGLFALGLLMATAVLRVPTPTLVNLRVDDIGWVGAPVGLILIGASICLMEGVPLRMQGWVLLVLSLAFGAQLAGQQLGGVALGGFLGAIAASLGASIVELRRPQLPRLVLFLPAFWLLVPGSLGLVGVTELAAGRESATDVALGLLGVAIAIALGLLVGSSVGRALRGRLASDPAPPPAPPAPTASAHPAPAD
ncbi:threonine/serine exporter ThrE family protein [Terracoccus sp. 273MFTsu3.1]|uniref:threonine/serine ThrE exporter family protein n=1 Tax=Terracoccus sp. 273MFTsu3.1 TaxID=1172188 RepID=UPI0003A1B65F|nr:threonine/serine exporter family protein [Terracoccus sp. 273MFTsu3.1]